MRSSEISIVSSVYFNDQKVKKTFDSLFKTEYPFHELVITVNGADAPLLRYLRDLPRTKLLVNKENVGCAHAENQAIKEVQTRYVFVSHTDMNFPDPKWLEKLFMGYLRIKNAAYVFPKNVLGDGHINFHPFMETDLYNSIPRDERYRRQYSDFDWYNRVQPRHPNLCSAIIKDSIFEHEWRGIRKTPMDQSKWTDEEKADADRYYKIWEVDADCLYGRPQYVPCDGIIYKHYFDLHGDYAECVYCNYEINQYDYNKWVETNVKNNSGGKYPQ